MFCPQLAQPKRRNERNFAISCCRPGLGVCPTGNGSHGNLREKFLERAMNTRFRPYHPEQSYLLPPSPSDWLAEGHLAYFIAEIVDTLEVDGFYARTKETGVGTVRTIRGCC